MRNEEKNLLDGCVSALARARALVLAMSDADIDEVTDFINEAGERWANHFGKMPKDLLVIDSIIEMLTPEDIAKMLMGLGDE